MLYSILVLVYNYSDGLILHLTVLYQKSVVFSVSFSTVYRVPTVKSTDKCITCTVSYTYHVYSYSIHLYL